jgi:hypothetical protein
MDAPLQPPVAPPPAGPQSHWVRFIVILVVVILFGVGAAFGIRALLDNQSGASDVGDDRQRERIEQHLEEFKDDIDQDGLSDDEERSLGTSLTDHDTDADGLPDYEEVSVFGTDPLARDSDGDGISDGFEVVEGTNPAGDGPLQVPDSNIDDSEPI